MQNGGTKYVTFLKSPMKGTSRAQTAYISKTVKEKNLKSVSFGNTVTLVSFKQSHLNFSVAFSTSGVSESFLC